MKAGNKNQGQNDNNQSVNPAARSEHIDMLRGAAAGFVLCDHLRSYTFTNFGSLSDPGLLTKGFYAATSFGPQAVIIFFALSGFLVGGKVLEDMLIGRWSWPSYFLRRLTRLWIVVIPALVITLILDWISLYFTGGIGYDRSMRIYTSGPDVNTLLDHSLTTFLGNIAFLQTIYVPLFGTNGPMWSLANEFWYYVIFPLAAGIFLVQYSLCRRLVAIGVLAFFISVLPWWLLYGGAIWAVGAGAAWLAKLPIYTSAARHNGVRILSVALPIFVLVFEKLFAEESNDLMFGLLVALALPALSTFPSFGKAYRFLARAAAEISYTLYLTHFPLLTVIFLVGFAPYRFSPGIAGAATYLGLLSIAVLWAVGCWWCFERNTDRVFKLLSRHILVHTGRATVVAHSLTNPMPTGS
jgi:peptidoglycan/LPS O-acetylase OafA/YrhL